MVKGVKYIDHVDAGDALGSQNDQNAAFQLGVDVSIESVSTQLQKHLERLLKTSTP